MEGKKAALDSPRPEAVALDTIAVWHTDDGSTWCLGCDEAMPGKHAKLCVIQRLYREAQVAGRIEALTGVRDGISAAGELGAHYPELLAALEKLVAGEHDALSKLKEPR